MTTIETLREAAERICGYATDATRGPWVWKATNDINYASVYHRTPDHGTVGIASQVATRDAHYIAAMHPGIGLALADWLVEVSDTAQYALDTDRIDIAEFSPNVRCALALARAVLGDLEPITQTTDTKAVRDILETAYMQRTGQDSLTLDSLEPDGDSDGVDG